MGKATITGGGADGLYTVTMDYGKKARDDAIVRVIARMGEIAQPLIDIQALVDQKKALEDAAKVAAEAAIEAYAQASKAVPVAFAAVRSAEAALTDLIDALPPVVDQSDEEKAQVAAAQAALSAANAALSAAQAAIKTTLDAYTKAATTLTNAKGVTAKMVLTLEFVKAEQAQLEKDLAYWQGLAVEETREIWCADLTENATGVVATLEIPGEGALVIIEPDAPAHAPATAGYLTAREVMTPAQAFFNAAILPGWQKFKPTYRRGTITALNEAADTADVLLEATDKSSAQKLVINQAPTLTAVPVQYMECNAGAFKVGDRCVVKFTDQDWTQPKIVGFVDHPKSCGPSLRGVQASSTFYGGAALEKPSSSWLIRYAAPLPPEAKPETTYALHPGHITWSSPHFTTAGGQVELSWRGPDSRYSAITSWTYDEGGEINWTWGPLGGYAIKHSKTGAGALSNAYIDTSFVWINGVRVNTGIQKVIAAALHRPNPLLPDKVVLRVCSDSYPQNTGTRKLVTFDLVPSDSLDGETLVPGTLAGILAATAFSKLNTYPADLFSTAFNLPVTDTWVTRQRPHFNNRGDKIATCISWRDVPIADNKPRIVAACFNPATWAMLEYYGPQGSVTQTRTANHAYTSYDPPATPPRPTAGTMGYTDTLDTQYLVLLAADFLDDDFVHVTLDRTISQTVTLEASASTYPVPTGSDAYTDNTTTTLKVTHSKQGLLAQRVYANSISKTIAFVSTVEQVADVSQTGPQVGFNWTNTHLAGDLSRGAFAIGFPAPAQYTISHAGPAPRAGMVFNAMDVPSTSTLERVEYDVFLGGALVAPGTNGNYAMAPNPATAGTTGYSLPYPNALIMLDGGTPPESYTQTTPTLFNDLAAWSGTYPLHQHAAVHVSRGIAYFGVGLQYGLGGLEMVAVAPPSTAPLGSGVSIKAVPAYITGAGPTIAMPSFAYRRGSS